MTPKEAKKGVPRAEGFKDCDAVAMVLNKYAADDVDNWIVYSTTMNAPVDDAEIQKHEAMIIELLELCPRGGITQAAAKARRERRNFRRRTDDEEGGGCGGYVRIGGGRGRGGGGGGGGEIGGGSVL
eukprot:7814832-Pyramimonas_sp.AAC.1